MLKSSLFKLFGSEEAGRRVVLGGRLTGWLVG